MFSIHAYLRHVQVLYMYNGIVNWAQHHAILVKVRVSRSQCHLNR